jgi:hypothetical protein
MPKVMKAVLDGNIDCMQKKSVTSLTDLLDEVVDLFNLQDEDELTAEAMLDELRSSTPEPALPSRSSMVIVSQRTQHTTYCHCVIDVAGIAGWRRRGNYRQAHSKSVR